MPTSSSQKICNKCKIRKCSFCKKEFKLIKIASVGKYKGKYCSRICYQRGRYGYLEKCRVCGKPARALYCSKKCQQSFWNRNDYRLLEKKRIWKKKFEIIKKLGGKCVNCGITDIRVLEINHIDRNKKKKPPKLKYTWQWRLKKWKENIENLQLLCANCHRIHTWEQMGYAKF